MFKNEPLGTQVLIGKMLFEKTSYNIITKNIIDQPEWGEKHYVLDFKVWDSNLTMLKICENLD